MKMITVAALALAGLGVACAPVDYCDDGGIGRDSALFASQTFVKDRLRSPASAKFPTSSDAPGVAVNKAGECSFVVVGYVDSQNGFGAMLRSRYVAEVSPDSSGRYTLGSLIME